ncbi:hypothetical protein TSO221_11335 [Azospirillum sp. TSO22-1]|nr:hypothetical protein TSO221_11335 [Azospirillum sp. TSO22-1]
MGDSANGRGGKPHGEALADDMLEGAEQIGAFMGLKPRQVYHLQDKLPVFQIGAKLFARKSTIVRWIAEQEGRAAQ